MPDKLRSCSTQDRQYLLTYLYKYLDVRRSAAATSTNTNDLFFVVTVGRGNGNISHRFVTLL